MNLMKVCETAYTKVKKDHLLEWKIMKNKSMQNQQWWKATTGNQVTKKINSNP